MEKMDVLSQSLMQCSIDANRNVALPSEAAGTDNNNDKEDGNRNEIETVEETIPINLKNRMAMDLIRSAKGIENDDNDGIDIKSDVADGDGKDANPAYRKFCVFIAS
eukprot:4048429-Ditylum_brightwellii.AAC.1